MRFILYYFSELLDGSIPNLQAALVVGKDIDDTIQFVNERDVAKVIPFYLVPQGIFNLSDAVFVRYLYGIMDIVVQYHSGNGGIDF